MDKLTPNHMVDTIKLRAVLKGEDLVVAVEGGFARRPAPTDGLVIETRDAEVFLPEDSVALALRQLQVRQSPAAARPHRAGGQLDLPGAATRKAGKKQAG